MPIAEKVLKALKSQKRKSLKSESNEKNLKFMKEMKKLGVLRDNNAKIISTTDGNFDQLKKFYSSTDILKNT
jgi:hypothetical protein